MTPHDPVAVPPTVSVTRPEMCPRCEDGLLTTVETSQEVTVEGCIVTIPRVRADECRTCGYRSLSGRETRLIDVVFGSRFDQVSDLVRTLRAAGYHGMFLRQDPSETALGFGSSASVENLAGDLRDLYLDNETSHVLRGLAAPSGLVSLDVANRVYRLKLPRIGEGENGLVFDHEEDAGTVFKVAKARPYCRGHLLGEAEQTRFFAAAGIPVARVLDADRLGRYLVKERLAGRSLAILYEDLGDPATPRHVRVRAAVHRFADRLLDLFARHPSSKISISPNNIFVVEAGERCECLLVDAGLAPFHDYSAFDFDEYWNVTVPQKIRRYREVGYLEADRAAPAQVGSGAALPDPAAG